MMKNIHDVQAALQPVFRKYNVTRAVLFGSVAKGTATEKSDVDLVVDSGLRGLKFVGLMEAIREALSSEVDVFDRTHIEGGSKLEREIRNTGIIIYEK